jgi:hypothetical protein
MIILIFWNAIILAVREIFNMPHYNPFSVKSLVTITLLVLTLTLTSCASNNNKTTANISKTGALATIQIEKSKQPSSIDCSVSVKIVNQMKDTIWDGVSYHVAFLNKRNVTIGKLLGTPRQRTNTGASLTETGQVLNAKCEDIAGVSLIYFGYYPAGKNQLSVHNNRVKVEVN